MSNPATYFKPGQSGNLAGKPKGIKNKIQYDVAKTLKENNFDPIIELIEIARDPKSGCRVRLEATMDLLSYVAPKLKSIEISGGGEDLPPIIMNFAGSKNNVEESVITNNETNKI